MDGNEGSIQSGKLAILERPSNEETSSNNPSVSPRFFCRFLVWEG